MQIQGLKMAVHIIYTVYGKYECHGQCFSSLFQCQTHQKKALASNEPDTKYVSISS